MLTHSATQHHRIACCMPTNVLADHSTASTALSHLLPHPSVPTTALPRAPARARPPHCRRAILHAVTMPPLHSSRAAWAWSARPSLAASVQSSCHLHIVAALPRHDHRATVLPRPRSHRVVVAPSSSHRHGTVEPPYPQGTDAATRATLEWPRRWPPATSHRTTSSRSPMPGVGPPDH